MASIDDGASQNDPLPPVRRAVVVITDALGAAQVSASPALAAMLLVIRVLAVSTEMEEAAATGLEILAKQLRDGTARPLVEAAKREAAP